MIEPTQWIKKHAEELGINPDYINPASVDVCLGSHVIAFSPDGERQEFHYEEGDSVTFHPGIFYLAHTLETVTIPKTHAAELILKSSSGRKGLDHAHCLAGDALIDIPCDRSKYPNGVPIKELEGKDVTVYAYNPDSGSFELRQGKGVKTGVNRELVEVSFKWHLFTAGWATDSIRCTPDHKFLTLDGQWVEAQHLKPDTRLRPLWRGFDGRYPTIRIDGLSNEMDREHSVIRQLVCDTPSKVHTHHKDGNKLNNSLDNLEFIGSSEHSVLHQRANPNFLGKKHTPEALAKISAASRGRKPSEETRAIFSKMFAGSGNPRYKHVTADQMKAAIREGGTAKVAAEMLGIHVGTFTEKVKELGYKGAVDFRRAALQEQNHSVVEVKPVSEREDVYCLQVEGLHNFVANGVVVHNSGWLDPNFTGAVTFEFVAHRRVSFTVGQRIAQIVYARLTEPTDTPYSTANGASYQGQRGATEAR